ADEDNASTLRQMAANLPELQRPQVAVAYPQDALSAVALDRFDAIVGRNVVSDLLSSAIEGVEAAASDAALTTYFSSLGSLLARSGILVIAEPDARMAQRLYRLV